MPIRRKLSTFLVQTLHVNATRLAQLFTIPPDRENIINHLKELLLHKARLRTNYLQENRHVRLDELTFTTVTTTPAYNGLTISGCFSVADHLQAKHNFQTHYPELPCIIMRHPTKVYHRDYY